jgi:hypothetical protein
MRLLRVKDGFIFISACLPDSAYRKTVPSKPTAQPFFP